MVGGGEEEGKGISNSPKGLEFREIKSGEGRGGGKSAGIPEAFD